MEYHGILERVMMAPDYMRHLNHWRMKAIAFFNAIIAYISMQNIVFLFHVRNKIWPTNLIQTQIYNEEHYHHISIYAL